MSTTVTSLKVVMGWVTPITFAAIGAVTLRMNLNVLDQNRATRSQVLAADERGRERDERGRERDEHGRERDERGREREERIVHTEERVIRTADAVAAAAEAVNLAQRRAQRASVECQRIQSRLANATRQLQSAPSASSGRPPEQGTTTLEPGEARRQDGTVVPLAGASPASGSAAGAPTAPQGPRPNYNQNVAVGAPPLRVR